MTADNSAPIDNNSQAAQLAQDGIRAAKSGRNAEARKLLRQSLQINDANEQAWLWLAAAVESPAERRICLENVLDINPENTVARRALDRVIQETVAASKNNTKSAAARSSGVSAKARSKPPRASAASMPIRLWILLGGVVVLLLVGGWAISVQRSLGPVATVTETSRPIPTLDFISQQQTLDAQSIGTATALALPFNPTITPLPTLFAVVASWTPKPSQTPPPSATPTATPLPLGTLSLVFVGEGRGQNMNGLYTLKGDGSDEQPLIRTTSALSDPAWAPDGRHLAYVSTINGNPTLLVANADGTQPNRLAQINGKYLRGPSWSPDGKQLVYAATNADTGHSALYVVGSDGTGLRALTNGQYECHDPAWSPDGMHIVYAADVTNRGDFQIYMLDLRPSSASTEQAGQGGSGQSVPIETPALPQPLTVSTNSNYSPVWSPDGHQIAFVSTRDGHAALYVMAPDGAGQKPLGFDTTAAESREPSWSPDGRWIVFSSNRDNGVFALYILALDNGQVHRLTDLNNGSVQPHFYPVH